MSVDAPVLLSMRDITKRFPGVTALDGVTFDVNGGEVHALVGENGAGKSTLMKIMSGVYPDFEGEMLLMGQPVAFHDTRAALRAGIAMIHQELNLIPELSVYENIFLGREVKSRMGVIDRRAMRRASESLMAELGLDSDPNQSISQLRVGQQQLVEIAKALSLNSRIIIMDEPTSALTDSEVSHLFEVIKALRERGVGVIYISHRLNEIFSVTDRITVLRDGKLVGSALTSEFSRARLISMMVGRDLDVLYPKEDVPVGDVVLRVENLTYTESGHKVLDDISLEVRKGEIVGVSGLMGAGRTQLLEALFGVYPPSAISGQVWLNGQPVRFASPGDAIDHGVGLVAEDRKQQSLVLERSVAENASLAALKRFTNRLTVIRQRAEREAVRGMVKSLNIKTPGIETEVNTLSGGNQQKVVLAKFMLTDIVLFLLDEPTRGIDVGAKAEIYSLVNQMAKDGVAFLVVSSEMPELLAVCDRLYVLCEGRMTGAFVREAFDQEAIMEAATRFGEKQGLGAREKIDAKTQRNLTPDPSP